MTQTQKPTPEANRRPPTRYEVGDAVVISQATLEGMRRQNQNRTGGNWISDSYMAKVEPLVGIQGKVTQVFPPSYQMVVEIDGNLFSMRDDFVEPVRH